MVKITRKQAKFAELMLSGKSQGKAYALAYNPKNQEEGLMRTHGCNLMKNPRVVQRMDELRKAVLERSIASIEKIEKELAYIAFDDISNYLSFRTEKQIVAWDNENKPVFEYKQIIEMKNSEDVDTRAVSEISMSPAGGFRFKLSSKDAALDKLAKIKGMYIERTENYNHNENLNIGVDLLNYSDETIKNAYSVLYNKKHNTVKDK